MLWLGLLLLFTLFAVENARTVRIRFIVVETDTRLAWALVLAGVLDFIVGMLLPQLRRLF